MTDKPILFSGQLIRSILSGKKTQTRRVIRGLSQDADYHDVYAHTVRDRKGPGYGCEDTLWVRETWQTDQIYDDAKPSKLLHGSAVWYLADDTSRNAPPGLWARGRTRPSIFMPRWASRLSLPLISVHFERLQDITDAAAVAEGVDPLFSKDDINEPKYKPELDLRPMPYKNYMWHGFHGGDTTKEQPNNWHNHYSSYASPVGSFASLWEKINSQRGYSWASNPWVWVLEWSNVINKQP